MLADRDVARFHRWRRRIRRPQRTQDLAARPHQRDPAIVTTETPPPHPGDLAECAKFIQQPRLIAGDPRRQDVPLQDRRRDREPGQMVHDLRETLERRGPAQRGTHRPDRCHTLPLGQEAPQRGRIDRLDFPPQPGQRATTQQPENLRIAPFPFRATRSELATQQGTGRQQPLKRVTDDPDREPPTHGRLRRQERPMCACVAREQAVEGAGGRPEERGRDPDGRRDPNAIAVARDVLDGDPPLIPRDPCPDRASGGPQLVQPRFRDRGPALGPCRDLRPGEIAQPSQQVVDTVERGRLPIVGQRLEAELEVRQRVRVE